MDDPLGIALAIAAAPALFFLVRWLLKPGRFYEALRAIGYLIKFVLNLP